MVRSRGSYWSTRRKPRGGDRGIGWLHRPGHQPLGACALERDGAPGRGRRTHRLGQFFRTLWRQHTPILLENQVPQDRRQEREHHGPQQGVEKPAHREPGHEDGGQLQQERVHYQKEKAQRQDRQRKGENLEHDPDGRR